MKALTFEEWDEKMDIAGTSKDWFEWARIGMIPEDEAVRTDWESNAGCSGARLVYEYGAFGDVMWNHCGHEDGMAELRTYHGGHIKIGKYIPRPTPAWTPKVGEAVFALQPGKAIPYLGQVWDVKASEKYAYAVRCHDGECSMWRLENLKPFDASKIGKPWEEI